MTPLQKEVSLFFFLKKGDNSNNDKKRSLHDAFFLFFFTTSCSFLCFCLFGSLSFYIVGLCLLSSRNSTTHFAASHEMVVFLSTTVLNKLPCSVVCIEQRFFFFELFFFLFFSILHLSCVFFFSLSLWACSFSFRRPTRRVVFPFFFSSFSFILTLICTIPSLSPSQIHLCASNALFFFFSLFSSSLHVCVCVRVCVCVCVCVFNPLSSPHVYFPLLRLFIRTRICAGVATSVL